MNRNENHKKVVTLTSLALLTAIVVVLQLVGCLLYTSCYNTGEFDTGGHSMSIEKVRAYFKTLGIENRILEFDVSSATVELAAQAVGVEGARIAKTLRCV